MPTYEYACGACGHEFELFQMMSEKPVRKCPECGRAKARRLIGAGAGLIFKGSGFYVTDYKKSQASPDKGASSSTGNEKTGDSGTSKKAQSAPIDKSTSNDSD